MRAIISQSLGLITVIAMGLLAILSCTNSAVQNVDIQSKKFLRILEGNADGLQWGRPVKFESKFPWAWDSIYFVDAYESTWDIPRGAKEFIGMDDFAEDYLFVFFTVGDSIINVLKIHESDMKVVLIPCGTQHRGYERSHEFYVTKDCIPPKVYLSILSSDCDSTTVFKYVCPR